MGAVAASCTPSEPAAPSIRTVTGQALPQVLWKQFDYPWAPAGTLPGEPPDFSMFPSSWADPNLDPSCPGWSFLLLLPFLWKLTHFQAL